VLNVLPSSVHASQFGGRALSIEMFKDLARLHGRV
jgi:hypothetical protein